MSVTRPTPVLVCGGAGYIGSHMCKRLAREGVLPVTFDNLSSGHRWAVKWGPLEEGDLLDPASLARVFARYRFSAVLHFAAKIEVGESVREPLLYYRNNVVGTLNLLDAMRAARVEHLVFSSTAAVYGTPRYSPLDERHPTQPINPYGQTKRMAEQMIEDSCAGGALRAVALRYFNACGADRECEIGEAHDPESHLMPSVIKAGLNPHSAAVSVFGADYPTVDGTCVRDYVHVEDLVAAHLAALRIIGQGARFRAFNLGTGRGNSVTEVIDACRRELGGRPSFEVKPRREGDPAELVASSDAARDALDWNPEHDLTACVRSAIAWHRKRAAECGEVS
jgi:UDP-glucose 4-epimerase